MSAFAEYPNNALAEAEDAGAGAAEAQLQAVGAETEAVKRGSKAPRRGRVILFPISSRSGSTVPVRTATGRCRRL